MTHYKHSYLRAVVAAVSLTGALCMPFQAAHAEDKQSVALNMVQKYDFGRNLQLIGFSLARAAQVYPGLLDSLGGGRGDAVIQRELARLAPKYQAQWDAKLAESYSAIYSVSELKSFADEGPASSQMTTFNEKRGNVGTLMRDKSQGLLDRYVSEALENVQKIAAIPKIESASAD
jgi:hypothetical protein